MIRSFTFIYHNLKGFYDCFIRVMRIIKRRQRKFHVYKLQKTVAALLVGDKLKGKNVFETFFQMCFPQPMGVIS